MLKFDKRIFALVISAVALATAFQNCGDVSLTKLNVASIEPSTIPPIVTSTPIVTTTTVNDPIETLISGPPQQIDPTQTQLQTVDVYQTPNVSACFLSVLPLSSPPPKCTLPVDIITSCETPTIQLDNGLLHQGGVHNLNFKDETNSRFEHFRFLRRPTSSIYSFRMHTPKNYDGKVSRLGMRIGTQNDYGLTIGSLGCDLSGDKQFCAMHYHISISKEPCDFRATNSPPQNNCTEDYPHIAQPQIESFIKTIDSTSSDPCVLKEDSIYYINVRFPYPDLDPGIINDNDRMQFNFDLSFQ